MITAKQTNSVVLKAGKLLEAWLTVNTHNSVAGHLITLYLHTFNYWEIKDLTHMAHRSENWLKKKRKKKKPNPAKQDDFVMQTRRVCMVSVVFTVFTLGSMVENGKEVMKNGVVLWKWLFIQAGDLNHDHLHHFLTDKFISHFLVYHTKVRWLK